MPSEALTLSQLLAERLLAVPDFQRGYAWEDRQLDDLREDLELVALGTAGGHRDHYTGTVVLLERRGAPVRDDKMAEPLAEAELVDGQQRLTTLLLLLHHLSRELKSYDAVFAEGIRQRFVLVDLKDGSVVPKLRLQGSLNDLWQQHILGDLPSLGRLLTAAQQRLAHASEVLASYVQRHEGESEGEHEARLMDLYATITQHLKFNLYTVSDDAEAAVVFDTVNSRGKLLTELEKAKNYLMYAAGWIGESIGEGAGTDLQGTIKNVWADIYETLMRFGLSGSASEDQLLRAHWYLVERPVRNDYDGADSVKRKFRLYDYRDDPGRLARELRSYVETLQLAAKAYAEMLAPDNSAAFDDLEGQDALRLKHNAERLVRTGNTANFVALLIGARMRWPQDASGLASIYDLCERLAFRLYRIRRARADTGQSDLIWLAHEMWQGDFGSPSQIVERLREITHRRARDERVFTALEAEDDWFRWAVSRVKEMAEFRARGS